MDFSEYFKFLLALIFVLGLIGVVAVLLRYFGAGSAMRIGRRARGEARRIEIVDVAAVDARRRLVLVRRDDREHLVLLGTNNDLVIEAGIPAFPASAPRPAGTNERSTPEESSFAGVVAAVRGDDRK